MHSDKLKNSLIACINLFSDVPVQFGKIRPDSMKFPFSYSFEEKTLYYHGNRTITPLLGQRDGELVELGGLYSEVESDLHWDLDSMEVNKTRFFLDRSIDLKSGDILIPQSIEIEPNEILELPLDALRSLNYMQSMVFSYLKSQQDDLPFFARNFKNSHLTTLLPNLQSRQIGYFSTLIPNAGFFGNETKELDVIKFTSSTYSDDPSDIDQEYIVDHFTFLTDFTFSNGETIPRGYKVSIESNPYEFTVRQDKRDFLGRLEDKLY